MGTDISRWADKAQYTSEAATSTAPVVTLLGATADPLGHIASLTAMYTGRVVRSLYELSDDDRRLAFDDMMKTELNGALEAVQFHFLVENVTRAWTHQAVRTREQFVAQESMRFAVVEDWTDRVALPASWPSWSALQQEMWRTTVKDVAGAYKFLTESGIPAEDARGLMPHSITTRLHMVMNLRTMLHQAGLRLCTQAQFEWRLVMAGMVNAIRNYRKFEGGNLADQLAGKRTMIPSWEPDLWQFELIADALKPVCYQKGACTFMASMDRGCTIRGRVDQNAKIQRPSSEWNTSTTATAPGGARYTDILGINPLEWAADPAAARADGGGTIGQGAE